MNFRMPKENSERAFFWILKNILSQLETSVQQIEYVSGFCHIHGKTPREILRANSNHSNTLVEQITYDSIRNHIHDHGRHDQPTEDRNR